MIITAIYTKKMVPEQIMGKSVLVNGIEQGKVINYNPETGEIEISLEKSAYENILKSINNPQHSCSSRECSCHNHNGHNHDQSNCKCKNKKK